MGIEWEPPKWRREGRTGPGPGAPKYAKAKDRNKIRKGGSVGGNPHSANGPYSTGGFKGKAKKGKASWSQKGSGRSGSGGKGGGKSSASATAPQLGIAYSLFIGLPLLFVTAFALHAAGVI